MAKLSPEKKKERYAARENFELTAQVKSLKVELDNAGWRVLALDREIAVLTAEKAASDEALGVALDEMAELRTEGRVLNDKLEAFNAWLTSVPGLRAVWEAVKAATPYEADAPVQPEERRPIAGRMFENGVGLDTFLPEQPDVTPACMGHVATKTTVGPSDTAEDMARMVTSPKLEG